MTPEEYKDGGANLTMRYSSFTTLFGMCLVASTGRGVCAVLFSDSAKGVVDDLRGRWPKARLVRRPESSHEQVKKCLQGLIHAASIKLHLHGTSFQIKVWEALLSIPAGTTSTYGDVAGTLGDRKLSRAVGMAVGSNPIGYVIPCHRVLKSTGEIGGYRWGVERKRAMLFSEASRGKN